MKIGFFEFTIEQYKTIDEVIKEALQYENENIKDFKTPISEENIFSITGLCEGFYSFRAWYKYEEK